MMSFGDLGQFLSDNPGLHLTLRYWGSDEGYVAELRRGGAVLAAGSSEDAAGEAVQRVVTAFRRGGRVPA